MKRILLTGLFSLLISLSFARQYTITADLLNVIDDKVKVTCLVPQQHSPKAEFIFPNVIPGSYALKEYGRYIDDFTAYDEQGNKLKVKKADNYNFTVENAEKLFKVIYYVNDSWEERNGKKFIFQPGGTNIDAGKNFVVNNYGFFGYIEGMKNVPYEITFLKPAKLKGYTYLDLQPVDSMTNILHAATYDILADNPVMFCQPNDASFKIGYSTIDICVYSERGKVQADLMAEVVKPIAGALEHFFGTLPVDHYLFMFYLADAANVPERKSRGLGSGFGALEHNHCSFYFMPEVSGLEENKKRFQDVCAHEFLHILTPLNLHSEEVEDFNFRKPVMSQHLWMYEGVTEYFAHLVMLQDSLEPIKDFMTAMRRKFNLSDKFDSFSMTDMSKNVVETANQKRYLSVYSRGALLAMMLDILIIDRSDGENSLKTVMMKLAAKYGAEKPFKDNELFHEIVLLTHPDVQDFFDQYVIGDATPDYFTYFRMIGYEYFRHYTKSTYYFGKFGIAYDDELGSYSFVHVAHNYLGVMESDILLTINDEKVDVDNIDRLYDDYFLDNDSGKEAVVQVMRDDHVIRLQAKPVKATLVASNYLLPMEDPTGKEKDNFKKFSGWDFRK